MQFRCMVTEDFLVGNGLELIVLLGGCAVSIDVLHLLVVIRGGQCMIRGE